MMKLITAYYFILLFRRPRGSVCVHPSTCARCS